MRKTAIKAATEAGKILLHYCSKNVNAHNKKNTYNLITNADISSDKEIVRIIKNKFPSHSILTEESGKKINKSDYCFKRKNSKRYDKNFKK